jgi:predicted Zn-dependent protease
MERKFQILYPFHFQISKVVSFHLTHLTPKHYIMRQKRERERELFVDKVCRSNYEYFR